MRKKEEKLKEGMLLMEEEEEEEEEEEGEGKGREGLLKKMEYVKKRNRDREYEEGNKKRHNL